jgi:hypothetical protein
MEVSLKEEFFSILSGIGFQFHIKYLYQPNRI